MTDCEWKVTPLLSSFQRNREALRSLEPAKKEHEKEQEEKHMTREVQHLHLRRRLLKPKRRRVSKTTEAPEGGAFLGCFLVPRDVDPSEVAEGLAKHLAELELEVPVTITPVDAEDLKDLPPGDNPSFPGVKVYMEEEIEKPLLVIEVTSRFIQEHYPGPGVVREASISSTAYIKKTGPQTWRVYSEKGKNMGTYNSRKEAEDRLRQIEFFKHKKG